MRKTWHNGNIFVGHFILSIKIKNYDKELYKERFVVQSHKDVEKGVLEKHSSNLKKSSIRLLLTLAGLFGYCIWSQDISQAYSPSAAMLSGDISAEPTTEFKLLFGQLIKRLKPLFGCRDSGDYCYKRFTNHIRVDLIMTPTGSDSALFFIVIDTPFQSAIGTYVDDTIYTGNAFSDKKSRITEEKSGSEQRECNNLNFAVIKVGTIDLKTTRIHEKPLAERIKLLAMDSSSSHSCSKRGEPAWLVNTRLDLACRDNLPAAVNESFCSTNDIEFLSPIVSAVHHHIHRSKSNSDSTVPHCVRCFALMLRWLPLEIIHHMLDS